MGTSPPATRICTSLPLSLFIVRFILLQNKALFLSCARLLKTPINASEYAEGETAGRLHFDAAPRPARTSFAGEATMIHRSHRRDMPATRSGAARLSSDERRLHYFSAEDFRAII